MKRLFTILFAFILIFSITSCGNDEKENKPKEAVSMSTLESAIKAQIKADLISSGVDDSTFKGDMLPNYRSVFLADVKALDIPPEYDISVLEDAVAVMHNNTDNADLIVIAKAKEGELSSAEGLAQALRKYQLSLSDSYLPDQINKIEENIIKSIGNYIIYITYDDPKRIEAAILEVIQ